jgi:hypothetical protein
MPRLLRGEAAWSPGSTERVALQVPVMSHKRKQWACFLGSNSAAVLGSNRQAQAPEPGSPPQTDAQQQEATHPGHTHSGREGASPWGCEKVWKRGALQGARQPAAAGRYTGVRWWGEGEGAQPGKDKQACAAVTQGHSPALLCCVLVMQNVLPGLQGGSAGPRAPCQRGLPCLVV